MEIDSPATKQAALRLAALAFDFFTSDTGKPVEIPYLDDTHGSKPQYSKERTTAQGLILELYVGVPRRIWTPWGAWNCWGASRTAGHNPTMDFLRAIGTVDLWVPPKGFELGNGQRLYAVTNVQGIELPYPTLRESSLSKEDALNSWNSLAGGDAKAPTRKPRTAKKPLLA